MKHTFRQSMTWLHTWSGIVFGWLLFAIFFAGTLAVFRHEVDYWMAPELHAGIEQSVDAARHVAVAQRVLRTAAPGAARWVIELPTHRAPVLRIAWQQTARDRLQRRYIDGKGETLSPRDTRGGTMIYRFHYGLLLGTTGMWLVGALGMAMLVALASALIIHAKIFKEFFTFRPTNAAPRAWLDGHTVSGVMTLPFCLMITYSGLVIWWFIWMPAGWQVGFAGDRNAFFRAAAPPGLEAARPSGQSAPLTDLAALIERSPGIGGHDLAVSTVTVISPGDAAARVDLARISTRAMWGESDVLRFDGVSGEYIARRAETGRSGFVTHRVFRIIHEIKFADTGLRWLYFLMSAVCTAMIGSGTVLWSVKRRSRHIRALAASGATAGRALATFGIDALNVGVIAGMCVATGAYFWANRLIPAQAAGRAGLEVNIFFAVWLGCAVWALAFALQRRRGLIHPATAQDTIRSLWRAQWLVGAALAAGVPVVDEITTRGVSTALARQDTVSVVFHVTVLTAAVLMALVARKAGRPSPSLRLKAS